MSSMLTLPSSTWSPGTATSSTYQARIVADNNGDDDTFTDEKKGRGLVRLTNALIEQLQSTPVLEETEKVALAKARGLIDIALGQQLDEKGKDGEKMPSSAVVKVVACKPGHKLQAPSRVSSIMAPTSAITGTLHMLTTLSTRGIRRRDQILGFHKRSLVVSTPLTQFSLQQSNETIMDKVFGQRFSLLWAEWYTPLSAITLILVLFWSAAKFLLVFVPLENSWLPVIAWVQLASIVFCAVANSFHMNYALWRRSILTFDAAVFLFESLLYCLAYYPVFCFSDVGLLFGMGHFVGTFLGPLAADSFIPKLSRMMMRITIGLTLPQQFTFLALLYFGASANVCQNSFDLTRWRFSLGSNHQQVDNNDQTSMRRISMTSFFLNHGFTVSLLTLRSLRVFFCRSEDLSVIRSRVLLREENAVREGEEIASS